MSKHETLAKDIDTVDGSEIPRPTTWDVKNLVNNGINYQPQLVIAEFLTSRSCVSLTVWGSSSFHEKRPAETSSEKPQLTNAVPLPNQHQEHLQVVHLSDRKKSRKKKVGVGKKHWGFVSGPQKNNTA